MILAELLEIPHLFDFFFLFCEGRIKLTQEFNF